VLTASLLGFAVALLAAPRRMVMPFVVLATGLGTFVLIGIAGASVIERYLAVAALALLIFAAVAFGGWTMLEPGSRLRRAWMGVAVALIVFGVAFTATRISLARFEYELSFRGTAHDDLVEVLGDPRVQAGLRCGPLTLPNHKLVPDSRWIADLPYEKVIARADPQAGRIERGVGIYVTSRFALFKHAITNESDSALVQVPPPGFERIKVTSVYSAYVAC
jgi:hypothetical protein